MDYNRDGIVDEQLIDIDGDGIADGSAAEIEAMELLGEEDTSMDLGMEDVSEASEGAADGGEDVFMTTRG